MKSLQESMCADKSRVACATLWAVKNNCVALTAAEVAAYPPMTLDLNNGVKLAMSAKDYLLQGSPTCASSSLYALGIRDGGSAGGTGFIIGYGRAFETTIIPLRSCE